MLKNFRDPQSIREILVSLLSTSGTLAGISMALVGFIKIRVTSHRIETMADDLFLFSSLGFVVVCYLVFFALRHLEATHLRFWTNLIDGLFLGALTCLLAGGFVTVYATI